MFQGCSEHLRLIDELSRPRILKPGTDAQKDTSVLKLPMNWWSGLLGFGENRERTLLTPGARLEIPCELTCYYLWWKASMLFHRSAENFLFILYEIVEEWDWPLFLSLINGSNRIVFSQPGYRIVIENGALPWFDQIPTWTQGKSKFD